MPRHVDRGNANGALHAAANETVSLGKRYHATRPHQPAPGGRDGRRGVSGHHVHDLAAERIAEAVDGANEVLAARVIADRGPQFVDEPRQAGVCDIRVGPELVVKLLLREGTGPCLQEDLKQPERLRRQRLDVVRAKELACAIIEDTFTETDVHRRRRGYPAIDTAYTVRMLDSGVSEGRP